MPSRKLIVASTLVLASCLRLPQRFTTPTDHDTSVLFPFSVGRELVEVNARESTYDMDGEVLRALMIAGNDYLPGGLSDPPCPARLESLDYRFTRRDDIIFVYITEDFAHCGVTLRPIHSGAKYAIHKDGRILRRIIDGVDEDNPVWRLKTADGTITVVTEPGVRPEARDLGTPDSGILKIVTDPVDMPGVLIIEREADPSPPVPEGAGNELGASSLPFDDLGPAENPDAGTPVPTRDGGTPQNPDATTPGP